MPHGKGRDDSERPTAVLDSWLGTLPQLRPWKHRNVEATDRMVSTPVCCIHSEKEKKKQILWECCLVTLIRNSNANMKKSSPGRCSFSELLLSSHMFCPILPTISQYLWNNSSTAEGPWCSSRDACITEQSTWPRILSSSHSSYLLMWFLGVLWSPLCTLCSRLLTLV